VRTSNLAGQYFPQGEKEEEDDDNSNNYGLRCRDARTKFRKDWFGHSIVNREGYTDTHSSLYFFKIRKVG
jgi:hypothetical protein